MAVRVDQAGHHQAVARVDDLRIFDAEIGPDRDDLAVLDEHVALREVAEIRIDRDHAAALDENTVSHYVSFGEWSCPAELPSSGTGLSRPR